MVSAHAHGGLVVGSLSPGHTMQQAEGRGGGPLRLHHVRPGSAEQVPSDGSRPEGVSWGV